MRLKNKLLTVGCVAVAAATLLSGVACNEHTLAPFSKSLSSGKQQSQSSGNARAVDILFVIDDSNSMSEEQLGLDENFEKFLDKLVGANADFRLGAISTSHTGNNMALVINALENGAEVLPASVRNDVSNIKSKCNMYFNEDTLNDDEIDRVAPQAHWIDYQDMVKAGLTKKGNEELLKKTVQDLFRCEAIMGTKGNATEKGLATMKSALDSARDIAEINQENSKKVNFKRDGSILAIVFVTDENDCSSTGKLTGNACETKRNIEDSCVMTREDIVQNLSGEASSLVLSSGQVIKYEGDNSDNKYYKETMTLRDLCVSGDENAREALEWCLENSEDCKASSYIKCPTGEEGVAKCSNELVHRSDYYDFIINYVIASNEVYYRSQNASAFSESKTYEERREMLVELAESDVIVASILNRDQGIRYDSALPENWCGTAGSQSYRYQLFAEMFKNEPIYAPICCKNNEIYSAGSAEDEVVCSADMEGENGKFGPVLSVIGERIGKAVNTLCADSMPVTCNPSDCEDGKATCPCNYGCNPKGYFENSSNEYHLCNEFDFKVGVVDSGALKTDDPLKTYEAFTRDVDYTVNFESNYCRTRTGSPIQINLIRAEAGKDLVFDYPKQVTGK